MGVPIQEFLAIRRNRCVGSILGNAERDFFSKLTKAEADAFRTLVRDAIGSYHDSVLDLVRAEDSTRNDLVLEKLTALENTVRGQRSRHLPAAITDPASNGRLSWADDREDRSRGGSQCRR